ncbi:MAG: DUF4041 domain-containing protein [Desulfuromonadaceae bacterium]
MSLSDYFRGPQLKEECERLKIENAQIKSVLTEMKALDLMEIGKMIEDAEKELADKNKSCEDMAKTNEALHNEYEEKRLQILVIEEHLLLESFALYLPKFSFTSSTEYKDNLDSIREKQKNLIKSGEAAIGNQNWTVNNSQAQGRKLVNDMIKLVLRAFNNECDYCVDNVKFNNIELSEKRINQSFDAMNKLGRVMQVEISNAYKNLKVNELHLAHEFQKKKQEEKEAQKKTREELREQQKLEQEIRAAREKIEKERKHFRAALKELEARLKLVNGTPEAANVQAKIDEIQNQFAELDKEEKLIDYREQNAKAGYVYVISNIGSFGENVHKIGMTRRLEPMERVDELGDASVPFVFDVHAMIFSDNAPSLEAKLHEHFHANRINKLNNRKEFFRASIDEIEKVIRENFDKVVEINKESPAEHYRESLLIK